MASQRWAAPDFMGLTPAVDMRRSDKLYAISGRNYMFDAKGVKAPFGNRQLLPHTLENAAHIQGVRLKLRAGDRTFTFLPNAIVEWNESQGGWRFIYLTPDTSIQPYRWTYAYVNGVMYFCHPQTGILAYVVADDTAVEVDIDGVPQNAIAITEDNGRLIAIDDKFMYWSAQSDGTDFNPSLGGAGFQLISDRVSGFPIMVTSYTQGTLVWTTGGVMRSEFTGDSAVYRHRAIGTEYRPINSFCTLKIDQDTVVILDERGLFKSRGEAPEPYAPLFNEFLIDYLQRNNLKVGQNVRIEWDDLQRRLYLSISFSYASPAYEKCFVLYPPLDKWGEFSEIHYGIFPITVKDSSRADDYYAFADASGFVRYWGDYGSREDRVVERSADLSYPAIQKPFHRPGDEQGLILSSSGAASTVPGTQARVAGYYPRDGEMRLVGPLLGLDAVVRLGLMRLVQDDNHTRMSDFVGLAIGSVISGSDEKLAEDYNTLPMESEDWQVPAPGEDFGTDPGNFVNCYVRVIGTVDGRTAFDSAIPELVQFEKAIRYYACIVGGIWHIVEIAAVAPGEGFHVQSLDVTVTDGGLLL